MKLLLKILFFLLAIFQINISEAKVVVFENAISEIKFTEREVESIKESVETLESDFGKTCKSEKDLVDYRNLAKSYKATAAKGVASGAQYSVAFETKLASNLYPGKGYYSHFKAANTSLSNAMGDGAFANSMSKLGISIPRSSTGSILGKSPANWVWHHDVGAGVMQLVPKAQHTTGSLFWNTLHPGGVGGMSIWGK
ncbi:HNH endonuclease [Flavobacterium piscis]|uniref:Uncharacterized protein n=1 Tax=Flavobacterium piscis TaxID=1114874 RepID=A0ABU1YES1_9FLAO|nr:HNH endonuclease [Flavobacterium piscis]MDR7212727.1 hypothetical protein [Flavobacterium piscis]